MTFRRWHNYLRLATTVGLLCVSACSTGDESNTKSANVAQTTVPARTVAIYEGGLAEGWEYFGWSAEIPTSGPIQVDFGDYGGLILANSGLSGSYASISFDVTLPDGLDDNFMLLRLANDDVSYPDQEVELTSTDRDGVLTAEVAVGDLLAGGGQFDRLVFTTADQFEPGTTVGIDHILLTEGDPDSGRVVANLSAAASVDCAVEPQAISPAIYGTAFRSIDDQDSADQFTMGATGRRWGGNTTSRYNWHSGHFWNTAIDYYWRNVSILQGGMAAHERFLRDNWDHDVASAITVPMLDWVAKDGTSFSFPISTYGPQEDADPDITDAGNGFDPDGNPLDPPDPEQTSETSDPASIEAWVRSMKELADSADRDAPFMYFLDNEPDLWHDTHRDVHPDPLTYDELLERTIGYASAIRRADPEALIAGPSPWGWPAYFFSAEDAEAGFSSKPDRLAHGDQPIIEWYLDQLKAHEDRTGERLLDVLDVHFYPQGNGVYAGGNGYVDPDTAALRIRSTRALWDPTYVDESWIDEPVELIPRMQRWADEHYPGLKLSLGEYSFGAEGHMSGGLAQAEALGRFGRNGLFSAYYWTRPPVGSPVYWAFRAYRDYDGAGSHFLDWSVPTDVEPDTGLSVFASTDESRDSLVMVVLNTSPDAILDTTLTLNGCNDMATVDAYGYDGDAAGFGSVAVSSSDGAVQLDLAPYSINVVRLSG